MPNFTAGDMSPAAMLDIRMRSEQFIDNPRSNRELTKPIMIAKCLLENQQVKLSPTLQGGECVGMGVNFLRYCDVDIIDHVSETCDIAVTEKGGAERLDFAPNLALEETFAVYDKECKPGVYEWTELVARNQIAVLASLEVELANRLAAFLDANADTIPQALADEMDVTSVVAGNSIGIDQANWTNIDLYAEMAYLAEQIDMTNWTTVSGKNFHTTAFLNEYKNGQCCDNNDILKDGRFDFCFDTRNLDSQLGARYTFLVDPASYVFWSTFRHESETPVAVGNDRDRYRVKLPRLMYSDNGTMKPIWVDVTRQRICNNGNDGWAFKYILRGGLHQNIDDCNGYYGVLKFERTTV